MRIPRKKEWTRIVLIFILLRLIHNPRIFMDYIEGPLFLLAAVFMCGPTLYLLDGPSRYFLCLFPLFLLMGRMRSSPLRVGLWALSFVAQVCLVMGFLDWRWVA